jgi:serine phosphatase RsbU (regulator of sigma subunit)
LYFQFVKKLSLYSLLFLLAIDFTSAQNRKNIDSLFSIINTTKYDSLKIEAYNELVWEYYGIKNDSALYFAKKGISIAEKTNYKVGLGNALRYAGIVYERMANYPKALESQQKALSIYEKVDYKPGIANSLMNIGVIYKSGGEFSKALEYGYKSLKICEEIDQKPGIAANLGNLGNIHNQMGQKNKALECYLKAYEIDKEMKNDYGIGVSLVNIGSIYLAKKEYEKSLNYLIQSIEVRKKIGSIQGLAISYNTLGDVYLAIKNSYRAEECYRESLKLSKESGAMDSEKDANHGLYTVSKMRKDPANALVYYEEFVRLKDSIFNSEKNEVLNSLKTQYELEKQESNLKLKADNEKELIKEESRLREEHNKKRADQEHFIDQLIIIGVIVVLIVVLIFSFFLYNRFKITTKQNRIIESQKQVVEEKNKQITDSINYAQRIQTALLPAESDLKNVFAESFIYFQPKDIVSGDFIWLHRLKEHNNDYFFFAVADCTGHGVPGGFMSMLGTSFLNEIVIEKRIHQPAEVLNTLREKVIHSLKQRDESAESKDGMDIVFLKFDMSKRELTYASANNGFYIVNANGELKEFDPDKMPIGVYGEMNSFKQQTISLEKGSMIYTFTDGFADQFGGEAGKKFKYAQFEKLLVENASSAAETQKQRVIAAFSNWKKDYEQVDDVCLSGIRV